MKHIKQIIFLLPILFLALNSHAVTSPFLDNRPVISYSENHSYFAVSVPKKFTGSDAFTAVFKTETKELLFKIDQVIYDFKVSNNGQFLYVLSPEQDSNIQSWYVQRYSKSGVSDRCFVHREFLIQIDIGQYIYPYLSWKLFEDKIELMSEEKQITMTLSDLRVQSVTRDKSVTYVYDYDYNRDQDSLFGLNLLKSDTSYFTKDLASFLGYHEVSEKSLCEKYVFVKFIIEEDGTFSDVKIFAQFAKKSKYRVGEVDREWISKIQEYLSNYHFAEGTVPKGTPYWFYSGPLYLVKQSLDQPTISIQSK